MTISEKKEIDEKVIDLLDQYAALCRANGVKLFVVFQPEKWELRHDHYNYDFTAVTKSLEAYSGVAVVDLFPAYSDYIRDHHTKIDDYFWIKDGHHNSRGYQMMAQCIYENIKPVIRDSMDKK